MHRRKTIGLMAGALAAAFLTLGSGACASANGNKGETVEMQKMVIRVILEVKPEQATPLAEYLATERESVVKLDGCQHYELFVSPQSQTRFLLYQEWESEADFKRFQASDIMKKSFEVLGPMLAGPPQSAYFHARLSGPPAKG